MSPRSVQPSFTSYFQKLDNRALVLSAVSVLALTIRTEVESYGITVGRNRVLSVNPGG